MTALVSVLADPRRGALTAVHVHAPPPRMFGAVLFVAVARRRGSPDTGDRNVSVRHILHTFRPDERLGELRLGVAHLPLPPGVTGAASARQEGGVLAGADSACDAGGERTQGGDQGAAAGWDRAQGERENDEGGTGFQGGRLPLEEGGRRGMQRDLMWRSRWIYRDRRAPALEADELQVEVRGEREAVLLYVGKAWY